MSGLFATWILRTSQASRSAISSPVSASGATPCDSQAGPTTGPCGPEAAPASPSAPQVRGEGSTTSATSGPSSSDSSASAALQSSLASRLQARTALSGSTLYKLTWKARATPAQRQISALRASAPRTSDSDSGGWPTPRANDAEKRGQLAEDPRNGLPMVAQVVGWRTPTCQSPNSLRGNGQDPAKRLAQGHTVNLTDEVNWLKDNPQPARLTATGEMLTGSTAGMESGGQLNPAHSRWLMGLPPEWDACAPTETRSSRKSRKPSSKP